jgi:hypothetical protein
MSVPIKTQITDILTEIEAVTEDIHVRLHLAGMDANDAWNKTFEPRLLDARTHARDAKEASKAALHDTLVAFKDFQKTLRASPKEPRP